VTEAEQDVVDRLLGVLGLETLDEQRQALVGRTPGSLLDNHQVEVVTQLAAVADDLELHRQQVAELRNTQAIDLLGRLRPEPQQAGWEVMLWASCRDQAR